VLAGAVFFEQEDGAALDNVDSMIDEGTNRLVQAQLPRLPVEHGKKDHGEAFLHGRVLVELVQHDLRLRATLELDDDAHAVPVGLVAHVADVIDDLLVHQLGDALDQSGLVYLVRNLSDNDRLLFLGQVLQSRAGPHQEAPAAGLVGLGNAGFAVEKSSGGKVGALHVLQHFFKAGLGILDQRNGRVDHLGEVVRGNVGGHTHRNSI
jgi:hypothetical protein